MFKKIKVLSSYALAILAMFAASEPNAEEYLVADQEQYKAAVKSLQAGDEIILANGEWKSFEIVFSGQGTQQKPIKLRAQEKGKVFLTGQSNLRLAGSYLHVSGLIFRDGYTPSSAVIEFRRTKGQLATHSRVTEVVIDNYSNPDKFESDFWVAMYGKYNRVDHSYFVGKRNKGVTFAVRLNSKDSQQNYHKIDHNYFGYRPELGSNGGETLRIGTSHYSLADSFTSVENNVFHETNGEVEIISVKSGNNTIKGNLFLESRGTLTLRHGNGNLIEDNVFLGGGIDHTGGIRVINEDQTVRNNYLEGLRGYRFGSGLTIMNGVPNSPINRYHQVKNAVVENNTLIDVSHIQFAAGSDAERSATPVDSQFKRNLIVSKGDHSPFTIFDDISGISFGENVASGFTDSSIVDGLVYRDKLRLVRAENGLLYAEPLGGSIGASTNLKVLGLDEVGPSWYKKRVSEVPFSSGDTHVVSPGSDALYKAVMNADEGDTLLVEEGIYNVRKIIPISKTLTIKSKGSSSPKISFERSTLFEIRNGGSLHIEGLTISGKQSPDTSGNSVVRTSKWGMYKNYRLQLVNNVIRDLDVNHSFHLFDSGARALATEVVVSGNTILNVSGDLMRLDKERDDLGIYNAEYLIIEKNKIENVKGALVRLYRGGRDESTFGPHLTFSDNEVISSGMGSRNKVGASIYLHGVQVADIYRNKFDSSAPLRVEHTVGEPITNIRSNVFKDTAEIEVEELHTKSDSTANLSMNVYP